MTRIATALALLLVTAIVGPCAPSVGSLGTPAAPSATAEPSLEVPSGDATPDLSSPEPSTTPGPSASSSPGASASPTAAPTPRPTATPVPAGDGTTVVRSYFVLGSFTDNEGLARVLREVPQTKAVATAAMRELLAGPDEPELSARPAMYTAIPDGTTLLGISIANSIATVNLSREFESGGGSASMQARSPRSCTRSPSSPP